MNEEMQPETVYEAPAPQVQVLARVSLVLGIVGLLMALLCAPVGIVTGIGAAVCGHIALSKIKTDPDRWEGHGVALAGTIIGYAATALCLLTVVIGIIIVAVTA